MLVLAKLVLAIAAVPTPSPAPVETAPRSPVSVVATASKTEVTVGEAFTIELSATGPAGTTFTFPGEAATDAVELRTAPAVAGASPAPGPGTHRYEAAVYALGEAEVPPIPVRYRLADGTEGEASSGAVPLKVASLLPKDPQAQKLADVRGPEPVAIGRAFWVALGAALVLAAALVTWLVRRRRRKEAPRAAIVPELPPDAEALRALDALASAGLLTRGEYRSFYIRLATVAKRYLERRTGAPVLEMTTAETLAFLRGHPHGGDLLPVMRDVRGPAPVAIGRAFWVALGAALVLAAALVAWFVRRRRRREAPPAVAVPELPPDAEALRALDALAAAGLLPRGEYRSFYIRLAAVAKRYLERRLGAPVLEMTTAETLAFLRGYAHGGELLPVVRDVAEAADRIKFARGLGLSQEAERHLAAVRALVPALETRLRPAVAEPAGEGKAA